MLPLAPGTTAPVVSVTVPERFANMDWPFALVGEARSRIDTIPVRHARNAAARKRPHLKEQSKSMYCLPQSVFRRPVRTHVLDLLHSRHALHGALAQHSTK